MRTGSTEPWSPRSARRTWWISAALFFAAGALWAFGSPLVSYPDEDAHIVMAAAAGQSEFRGTDHPIRVPDEVGPARTDTVFEVPAAFRDVDKLNCFAFKPHVPASCAATMSTDRSEQSVATRAGRYPPIYYALVGWPVRFLTPYRSIYAMRLLTAALCAALFASALLSALSLLGGRLAVVTMTLALTPMVLYLTGGVNPSGPEIAAGLCGWATLSLIASSERTPSTRVIARAVIASALLITVRPLGLLMWTVLVAVVLTAVGSSNLRQHLRDLRMKLGAALVALCALVASALAIFHAPGPVLFPTPGLTYTEAARRSIELLPTRTEQMIGVFGWLDTRLPLIIPVAWTAAVLAVWTLAVAAGTRRQRTALVVALGAGIGVPVILEAARASRLGFYWQGRYTLPIAVGIPLIAAIVLHDRRPMRASVAINRTLIAAAASAQIAAFVIVLNRYTNGLPELALDFAQMTRWNPPINPTIIVAGYATAVAALGVLGAWLSTRSNGPAESPSSHEERGTADGREGRSPVHLRWVREQAR